MRTGKKTVRWTDCVLLCNRAKESQRQSMKDEQTEDMREQEESGPYAAMSSRCRPLVTFFLYGCHWRDDAAVRAHLQIHWVAYPQACMHAQQWLICKGKLRVTPVVPGADCCHASLASLLWAQTMTTQHHKTTEHQNRVSTRLEGSQLQMSSKMLLWCSWFYY